jgi:hypothetical protein
MQYSCNTFCVDARRQARRAFIAFSSDDTKVKVTESEHTKDGIQNFPEQLVNDDAQTSKITPVRNFPYKSYINVIDFVYNNLLIVWWNISSLSYCFWGIVSSF